MKPDELELLSYIYEHCTDEPSKIRAFIQSLAIPKRGLYILKKWDKKGLYEYGVSLDLGWLTNKGRLAYLENRKAK